MIKPTKKVPPLSHWRLLCVQFEFKLINLAEKHMSWRSLRNSERFDYKIYSKTGEKFQTYMRKDLVDMVSSIDEELKLVCKLTRFMNEYELSLLYDVVDVAEGIREARQLAESYEEIHVKLKRELGDGDYNENYSGYDTQISKITDWIRDSKLEIRKKKESRSNEAEQEKLERSIKEIYKL